MKPSRQQCCLDHPVNGCRHLRYVVVKCGITGQLCGKVEPLTLPV
jgi:hypothetical protein